MKVNYLKEDKSNFRLSTERRLQKVLADIFAKSSFSFNNQKVFVNVLFVDLSGDFKNAKVVVDTFGLDDKVKKDLVKELNKNFVKQIRGIIAQKIQMKYIPEIKFFLDEITEKASKVNRKIDEEIKKLGMNIDE